MPTIPEGKGAFSILVEHMSEFAEYLLLHATIRLEIR